MKTYYWFVQVHSILSITWGLQKLICSVKRASTDFHFRPGYQYPSDPPFCSFSSAPSFHRLPTKPT